MGFLTADKIDDIQSNRQTGNYLNGKGIDEEKGTKIRFLGDAITGVGGWRDGSPVRFAVRPSGDEFDITTLDVDMNGKPGKLKDFIASIVWNYNEEKIQIFEITQVGIQDKLIALHRNEDWGDVTQFDIILKKVKKGERVDYEVVPSPKGMGKLDKEIEKVFDETPIDLTKMYSGEDPFKVG